MRFFFSILCFCVFGIDGSSQIITDLVRPKFSYSEDSLKTHGITVHVYRNISEYKSETGEVRIGNILPAPSFWKQSDRFVFWAPDLKKDDRWLNIFCTDSVTYISSRLYSERTNHLTKLHHFNGVYGFIKDISENILLNRNIKNWYELVYRKKKKTIEVWAYQIPTISFYETEPYRLQIWFVETGNHYPITDPLMKSLLRGYDDLLEEWRANPTEEKTIEILKRKHAIEPIIG